MKMLIGTVATGAAVAGIAVAAAPIGNHSSQGGRGESFAVAPAQNRDNQGLIADLVGVPGDVACSLTATPDVAALPDRVAEMVPENLVAQVVEGSISREGIVAQARGMSASAGDHVAAAVKVPYSVSSRWLTDQNDLIAAARCVWVVTVHGPFEPRSLRAGSKPVTYDAYTATFDAASGEYLGVDAGPDLLDVITGANVPK